MPKIEWKLKDPKYCNGCIHSISEKSVNMFECKKKFFEVVFYPMKFDRVIRPKSCIEKYGE